MPTIKAFSACKICMYFADHGAPHFHIVGPDGQLVVRIADLRVIEGNPRKVDTREALAWAREHREALLATWHELRR